MERTKKRSAKRVSTAVKEAVANVVQKAANVVNPPASKKKISQDQMFSLIEKKAYEAFVARGCTAGDDLGDWYAAEKQVKKELGI